MVVAAEVGRRFSAEANQFLRGLVSAKSAACLTFSRGRLLVAQMALHVGVRGCELFRVCPSLAGYPEAQMVITVFERRAHVMRSVPCLEAVHASAQDVVVPPTSREHGSQETGCNSWMNCAEKVHQNNVRRRRRGQPVLCLW